jgi:drug/metabolite transporter (DMT)-like permease
MQHDAGDGRQRHRRDLEVRTDLDHRATDTQHQDDRGDDEIALLAEIDLALANALAVTAGGTVYAAFEGVRPLSVLETGVLAACALSLAVAYTFMVLAVRLADVSITAPFRYTVILWSLLAGLLVFDDVPDAVAFLGIALIAGSGLYTLVRERQLRRRSG